MAASLPRRVYIISPTGKAEDAEQYRAGGLHPVHLGDSLNQGRYRIVHKLGFGSFSTVWLARDTAKARFVSLKIARADFNPHSNELSVLHHLARRDVQDQGSEFVMTLLDDFTIQGPNGSHQCLVTQVAGRRLGRPAGVNHTCLGPARLLASQLFQGVRYLHSCNVGHGDLYTGNILMQLDSFDAWSEDDIYACLGHPVKEGLFRKDGKPLENCAPAYTVHPADLSLLEARFLLSKVLIIDFGQAYFHDNPPSFTTSPSQFSSPENLFRQGVCPSSDIWALGCNIFEISAGYTLFKALFLPRQDVMRDMVAMLGKLPTRFWEAWEERLQYFDEDGKAFGEVGTMIPTIPYPLFDRIRDMAFLYPADGRHLDTTLREATTKLQTNELIQMHDFLAKVFVLDPDSRITVEGALAHPFLASMTF
ncbi:kinase domain-containing protein [Melanomma pulvis-pyrius CBS 109.77]|uniref:non-specific serine/threonine protein kinase n=1 Tax=Melanomma pulvis-pyrius CBS 109.77 TaxID=1314802 RepID=A0A6A6WVB2_9PLEO|nr:kinase domain-containing protein [Melanomma pulvis-pyrius CBS 109.77]